MKNDNYRREIAAANAWLFLFALLLVGGVASSFKAPPTIVAEATR